ncbi:DUF5063 domain-containing protein [Nocardia camponoti]|uniref:DUF5063 domain-containing protein n=1 Tax=Nocardia camponoti TaxID=1616106 RepID=A0A917QJ48_9NOCA|nr:DUF5063 domain-containing protein [Nocardia camponoti]GGK51510.1 hypothetical protein GCM10011591_24000 [Nocardia camponoti]
MSGEPPASVVAFVDAARAFCGAVECIAESASVEDAARRLVAPLAHLVAAGSALPQVDPTEADLPRTVDRDAWYARYREMADGFGNADLYWTNLDIAQLDSNLCAGSLADDIADIWREMRTGIAALDNGSDWRDVVFEWRLSFHHHWGRHAVEALRPLHALLQDKRVSHSAG